MSLYPGQVSEVPFYLHKDVANSYNPVFAGQDYSGHTIKFKVWQYDGASLDIDDTATVSFSSPDTELGIALTASQCGLTYARGYFSIHNETTDKILLRGELIVIGAPN